MENETQQKDVAFHTWPPLFTERGEDNAMHLLALNCATTGLNYNLRKKKKLLNSPILNKDCD